VPTRFIPHACLRSSGQQQQQSRFAMLFVATQSFPKQTYFTSLTMPATTRAKAVEGKKPDPQTSKVNTPASKAAPVAGRAKRKLRTEEDNDLPDPDKPAKERTEHDASSQKGAIASGPTAKLVEKPNLLAPKAPRGRPKKNNPVSSADPPAEVAPDAKAAAGSTRATTRARAGSVAEETAKGTKVLALAVKKKKVTFTDEREENKENVIVVGTAAKRPKSGDGKTKLAEKLPGLKAKPVRKPAGRGAVAKGGKKAQGEDEGFVVEKLRPEPLSPKKDVQVAKGGSVSDYAGDELSGPKTPPRQVGQSPVKLPSTAVQEGTGNSVVLSPSRIDNAASIDELQHPSASFEPPIVSRGISVGGSPPRRPPPSPFKNSMKESPKKLGDMRSNSSSGNEPTVLKESIMMKSPKKFNIRNTQVLPVFNPPSNTNLAASLFKSPARRPQSPIKGLTSAARTAVYSASLSTRIMTASKLAKSPRKLTFSSTKNLTSSFKAVKSPEAAAKVHKMTPEEQAKMLQDDFGGRLLSFQLTEALPYIANSTPWQPEPLGEVMKSVSGSPSRIPIRSPFRFPLDSPPAVSKHSAAKITLATTVDVSSTAESRSTTPPDPPTEPAKQSFSFRSPATQHRADEESEDELQSNDPIYRATPRSKFNQLAEVPYTPTPMCVSKTPKTNLHSMTALAKRFGAWTGASPDKKVIEQRKAERSVFSPIKTSAVDLEVPAYEPEIMPSPQHPCYFEEAMAIREDEDDIMLDLPATCSEDELFRQSQMSNASQEYGDENAIPIDPALLALPFLQAATCTPARVFNEHLHVIHTVSKVPLKPAAEYDDSPLARPVRRCHSMSGLLSPRTDLELQALRQIHPLSYASCSETASASLDASKVSNYRVDETGTPRKSEGITSVALSEATPDAAHTPRSDLNSRLLGGAVVFVDVHTTEGADASGIFMELLGQMGAKCVKQWNWNSRASLSGEAADGESRVGITHVVFKDGGKRTMEKVREAGGLVVCVGVGWVLE